MKHNQKHHHQIYSTPVLLIKEVAREFLLKLHIYPPVSMLLLYYYRLYENSLLCNTRTTCHGRILPEIFATGAEAAAVSQSQLLNLRHFIQARLQRKEQVDRIIGTGLFISFNIP